jgi:hypothetical protein
MTTTNLEFRALNGKLTVEEVKGATKEKLEAYAVLYCSSSKCGVEVVEAILDKNVSIDVQSGYVSLFLVLIIK